MIQQSWFLRSLLFLGMVALSAFGQSANISVKVPFSFNVAEAKLPAGEYVLSSEDGKVTIRDSRGRTLALALSNGASGKIAASASRAIFECYGDRCFLSQFWIGGQNAGHQLLRSALETKIAAKQAGQYFAVLGTPSQR